MSNQVIQCPTCSTEVSELAVSCPKCGRPLLATQMSTNTYVIAGKNKIVAGLLAIFLGTLGIHYFYLGDAKKGGLMLGATIISCILCVVVIGFILLPILGIICLITGIMYMVMDDQQFNQKFNRG